MIFTRDTSKSAEMQPIHTWRLCIGLDGKTYPSLKDSNGCVFGIETHSVSADGVVSPSIVCGYGCEFHEFVTLEGWDKVDEPKHH